jgi:anaerobic selenocysteine-containing dehydrogenase
VTVEDGRATKVIGDRNDPLYGGYTCIKGRSQPQFLYGDDRLLTSLKRLPDGRFVPIPVEEAIDEIAERLLAIRSEYGPRAIAGYAGTMKIAPAGADPLYKSLMSLLGSELTFDTITIDKGGKQVAASLFGKWLGPVQGFDRPEVAVLFGANPLVTYTGFPAGNPNRWLKEQLQAGMKLIVVDPRRSTVAEKASLHIQSAPGHDPEIMAAIARVIIDERRHDVGFLAENAGGLGRLAEVLQPYTAELVAERAGIQAEHIVETARTLAGARRGFVWSGTGPSMAGTGTLAEYLVLVLTALCGFFPRAGDVVKNAPTLVPLGEYKAQASSPVGWAKGEPLRVRSLRPSTAGVPTAAAADEILLRGPGQVRALISWNGNPVVAFPDQLKTVAALKSLDLLVQIDTRLTATAGLADYVIAPTMPLEVPSSTVSLDVSNGMPFGYGLGVSYANYTPAVVDVPAGSDLIEEWRFFAGLYERVEAGLRARDEEVTERSPLLAAEDTEDLLDIVSAGSRISLTEVRSSEHGRIYVDEDIRVGEREPGWVGRFDLASPDMMAALSDIASNGMPGTSTDAEYPFRLVCRRANHVYNSSCNVPATNHGRPYNPLFVHPDDLAKLRLDPGDLVDITSDLSSIPAVIEPDHTMRRGVVTMWFGFGRRPDTDDLVREVGTNANRLVATDAVYDRYTGQPRMSNVPVKITKRGGGA